RTSHIATPFPYTRSSDLLMNGGRKKWELEGRPLTTAAPSIAPASYQGRDADLSIRALRDEVVAAVDVKPMIDVRSPDEFSGKLRSEEHTSELQSPDHLVC